MTGRRGILLAGLAGLAARRAWALPVPAGDALAFRLVRHGDEIGRHTLRFDRNGVEVTVRIAVDALVTLLSVPLVRYSHRVTERWRGGTLLALDAQTDRNGDREWAQAHRGDEQQYVAPAESIGTSYWNRQMLDGPMISLEDGVLLQPRIVLTKGESVRLASGETIPADRYRLSGAFAADVWYDRSGTWTGLTLTVADGSTVQYERL
jgi:hypothetical protein